MRKACKDLEHLVPIPSQASAVLQASPHHPPTLLSPPAILSRRGTQCLLKKQTIIIIALCAFFSRILSIEFDLTINPLMCAGLKI